MTKDNPLETALRNLLDRATPETINAGIAVLEGTSAGDQIAELEAEVERIRRDADEFDGDRRGHWAALEHVEDLLAKARTEAALAAQPARVPEEAGWLVEINETDGPFWWSLAEPGWVKDSLKALRFARREDAEAYSADMGWTEHDIVEHLWVGQLIQKHHAAQPARVPEGLVEFAKEIIQSSAWDGADLDGGDVQNLAIKYGLIVPVPGGYDPAKHGESDFDPETGDLWYDFAEPLLAAAPTPAELERLDRAKGGE